MGNDLQSLLARLAAGQLGAGGGAAPAWGGAAPAGYSGAPAGYGAAPMAAMPAGLLADPNNPMGSSPVHPTTTPTTTPTTPPTPAPKLPVTPPVLPYQGDYNRYGMSPEHLFFGGVNGQPYGLTSFSGQATQQPDQKAMEALFKQLWDDQQQQIQARNQESIYANMR